MDFKDTVLGIELGSTRIKSVLLGRDHLPLAQGGFEWENRLENGVWTYSESDILTGLRACYRALNEDVESRYGHKLETVGAIGISAMMHGYLALDRDGNFLTAFRTWRNMITSESADRLTEKLGFNIPQRWSIAHLYQAMLNGEEHLSKLDYLTTLSGYIHRRLTGRRCIGIGDASGMFPVDRAAMSYHPAMAETFNKLLEEHGIHRTLRDLLPEVLPAGSIAGYLTQDGVRLLDESETLQPGIPLAPCEGDAGTGMVATNSVRAGTGNVSAGTSVFAMLAVDRSLGVHRELDMVATPAGLPVAMVHCNNCTSDINAWVQLFSELARLVGSDADKGGLFSLLFEESLRGEPDCGGLISFNYVSGEEISGFADGRAVFARSADSSFTLPNFMRMHLYSALATLKLGIDILLDREDVRIDRLYAHGGFFKTPGVGGRILSAAVGCPVCEMDTAGEGGAYGMALLTAYMLRREPGVSLEDYLDSRVFAGARSTETMAQTEEILGFARFMERYKAAFPLEEAAIRSVM